MPRKTVFLFLAAALATPFQAMADNGSYTYAGGSFSTGTAAGQSISIQGAALTGTTATLSLTSTITSYGAGTYQITWTCGGGSISIARSDHSLEFQGTFLSGTMSFSGSGGGRGGHVARTITISADPSPAR